MSEDNLNEDIPTVLYRPSYSATWLNCEAALLDSRFYPDSAGEDAARGTVFHNLMNEWLTTGKQPSYRLGHIAEIWQQDANQETDKPFLIEIDADMFEYGRECIDYLKKFSGKMLVEQRVDISRVTPIPNQSGTLDVAFLSSKAVILDWKYGTGVRVNAKDNSQLLLYAVGVFEEWDWLYDFQRFELHIAQPRLKNWDVWEVTRQELLDWIEWATIRAKAAWKRKNRSYTVGTKQCLWCRASTDCRAKLAALEAIADESFEETTVSAEEAKAVTVFTPPRSAMETTVLRLSTQELARIYAFRRLFETWFRRIGEVLLERGSDGEDIGEFYITEGRKFRHWKQPKKVAEKLISIGVSEDEIFKKELLSPNQMTKVLREYGFRGKVLEQYIELFVDRLPGKPTLVRKGEDDREALPDYTGDFE
jgi:hypothetical protein